MNLEGIMFRKAVPRCSAVIFFPLSILFEVSLQLKEKTGVFQSK